MIQIYTDGSCFPNPNGFGGWAFVATHHGKEIYKQAGSAQNTTNNRMELHAILQALQWIQQDEVYIYSDSQYAVNSITIWFEGWQKTGKINKRSNIDLIKPCYDICMTKNVKIFWIKGHNNNRFNDMADDLCNNQMTTIYKQITGAEISKHEIQQQFVNYKKTALEKRMDNEDKRYEKLLQKRILTQNTHQKLDIITTDINNPNYIIVNGIKYKKSKK